VKRSNTFVWFQKWLFEGYSVKQLEQLSGHSVSSLRRIVHYWLAHPPQQQFVLTEARSLIFDGSFTYKRAAPVVAVLDGATGNLLACKYGVNENSQPALRHFFRRLKEQGLKPISCTVDGNLHVMRIVQEVWPQVLIQRCRVHVQRQGLMWCRLHPKTTMGRQLRELFLDVLEIQSVAAQHDWLERFAVWNRRFGEQLQGPVQGWVMSDLKRARSMLLKAIPNLFHYVKYPTIPASTNRVEGFFSTLKRAYKRHTGLALHQRENFILWYCFFYSSSHENSTHF